MPSPSAILAGAGAGSFPSPGGSMGSPHSPLALRTMWSPPSAAHQYDPQHYQQQGHGAHQLPSPLSPSTIPMPVPPRDANPARTLPSLPPSTAFGGSAAGVGRSPTSPVNGFAGSGHYTPRHPLDNEALRSFNRPI